LPQSATVPTYTSAGEAVTFRNGSLAKACGDGEAIPLPPPPQANPKLRRGQIMIDRGIPSPRLLAGGAV
jgi:hypothetical protein